MVLSLIVPQIVVDVREGVIEMQMYGDAAPIVARRVFVFDGALMKYLGFDSLRFRRDEVIPHPELRVATPVRFFDVISFLRCHNSY